MIDPTWDNIRRDIERIFSEPQNNGVELELANLITIDSYLQHAPAPASNGVDDLLNRLRVAFTEYSQTTAAHIQQRTSQNENEVTDDLDDILDLLEALLALIWSGITSAEGKRHYKVFIKDAVEKYKV